MSFDDTRYFLLLLQAFGLEPLRPGNDPNGWTLRALFTPTFHADCCLTLVGDGAQAAIEWIVLAPGARSAVMHEMGFRGFAPLPGAAAAPKIELHEVTEVREGPLASFMTVVAAVDPYSLPTGESLGVDGMSVQCESQRGSLVHGFRTWSPSHRSDPVHHRYLMALLALAKESLGEPRSHRAIAEVCTYLR